MPLELFGDFSFVGGDNTSADPNQDRQQCINWYVELSPSKAAKEVKALLGCPGLIQLVSIIPAPSGLTLDSDLTMDSDETLDAGASSNAIALTMDSSITMDSDDTLDGLPAQPFWPLPSVITDLPVRGAWVLPGDIQALVVIANGCYLVTVLSFGSSTTPGALSISRVGTLNTSAGPVCIRDNGVVGTAVLVDGPYGYYYGYNAVSAIGLGTFQQITDPAFLGANTVAFIDGWWIFNQPGTQTFYTNGQPYSLAFNGSYFALKDAFSDQLMGVIESKEELWLLGEKTTEIWYDAGGQYFPFQRLVGTMLQVGCKAAGSIARLSSDGEDGLIWFGRSERGENIVVRTTGFSYEVVSTPAVSNEIARYVTTSDAIAYTYQEDTHEFYVLTFPTADRTWVFDASVPLEFAWHQRLSYDPYAQAFHRHRSNCYMNLGGMRVVGDYQNGTLYQLTRAAYTDAGWPILARRRSPHIWNPESRQRVFMAALQVDFTVGAGTSSGLGSNPVARLRISRDGGETYGQQWPAPLGAIGRTLNRTMWRRLSFARDGVLELEVIDPVNRDIVGATLRAGSP